MTILRQTKRPADTAVGPLSERLAARVDSVNIGAYRQIADRYARIMTTGLRALRRIPGIK